MAYFNAPIGGLFWAPTDRLAAAELSRLVTVLSPLSNESSVRREFLDAAVSLIGHIQQVVRPDGN
jgi:hypothetical protein